MSSTSILAGRHGPPTNVPAATTYNPFAGATFPLGTPVSPQAIDAALPHTVFPGNASDATITRVIGLASTPGVAGHRTNIQSQGVLTLTADQWDAVTGESGGLTRGVPYYLSAGADGGRLTQIAPTIAEDFVVRVGIALSSTDFLILAGPPKLING